MRHRDTVCPQPILPGAARSQVEWGALAPENEQPLPKDTGTGTGGHDPPSPAVLTAVPAECAALCSGRPSFQHPASHQLPGKLGGQVFLGI